MIKLIVKTFIKDYNNTADKEVRERYGVLSGVIGIICNALLFAVKLVIGLVMRSIAIMSDAFNNLSDMGSSVMSIISAKLSNRAPDEDHPFGHGRFEYISSLIISFLIMLVGFELLKSSAEKIFAPEPIVMKPVLMVILVLSVLLKLWLCFANKFMGKKVDSKVMLATASDSLNDVIATSAVIVSSFVGYILKINIDGYIGLLVSLLIMKVGFEIAKDTVDVLLGSAPDAQTVNGIETLMKSSEFVLGIHDLIVHDYGPGRVFASVHAEVADDGDICAVHEQIDALEQKARGELNIELVIHMDPIATNCETTERAKADILEIVRSINEQYTIHDFRMTDGENRINLIFDIVVPASMNESERKALTKKIGELARQKDERFVVVIQVDSDFTAQIVK